MWLYNYYQLTTNLYKLQYQFQNFRVPTFNQLTCPSKALISCPKSPLLRGLPIVLIKFHHSRYYEVTREMVSDVKDTVRKLWSNTQCEKSTHFISIFVSTSVPLLEGKCVGLVLDQAISAAQATTRVSNQ